MRIVGNIRKTAIRGVEQAKKLSSQVTTDVKTTAQYYKNNVQRGWEIGNRVAKVQNLNSGKAFYSKVKGAITRTKVKKEHLPAILGGVGFASPLPGGSVIGFGIGKAINYLSKYFK